MSLFEKKTWRNNDIVSYGDINRWEDGISDGISHVNNVDKPIHNKEIQNITDWNFNPSTNTVINAAIRGEEVRIHGNMEATNVPWNNTVSGFIRRTSEGEHWMVEVYRSHDSVNQLDRVARRFFGANGWAEWIYV